MTHFTGWDKFILALIIIGALNWGLIGFFRFDLVAAIFGGQLSAASRAVFAIVGLAGLWAITLLFRHQQRHA
ncbi:MAG: DUF378 domain-containing protein [Firmicutes bacterium]|nr:DUF378 domain-containing protein [Bacillota bacterium]